MRISHLLLVAAAGLAVCGDAAAHAFSPGLLEIRQQSADAFVAHWTPPRGSAESESGVLKVEPIFPANCVRQSVAGDESGSLTLLLRCSPPGLDGAILSISNLAASRSDALIRLRRLDGTEVAAVVHAGAPEFPIPAGALHGPTWQVAGHYIELGLRHIAGGWDHLMFLSLLVLLARAAQPRLGRGLLGSVLWTATAFTLAHSITLSLAALDVVRLPPQPVEALIALSICFLAAALLPGGSGVRHYDAAFAFGLLHGLGFAGALRDAGLPPGHLPLALVSFNLGVEIGQMIFVAAIIVFLAVIERLGLPPRRLQVTAAYAMGTLAAAVTIERVVLFWR